MSNPDFDFDSTQTSKPSRTSTTKFKGDSPTSGAMTLCVAIIPIAGSRQLVTRKKPTLHGVDGDQIDDSH